MSLHSIGERLKHLWRRLERRPIIHLFVETGRQWYGDNTFQLGAALAYYTVFSLAPVAIIAIAVAGAIFGQEAARGQIAQQIGQVAGPEVAQAVEHTVQSASTTGSGWWATIISIVVLVVGATTVFGQLQQALNTVWGVRAKSGRGFWGMLKDRFWSFTIVLAVGFILLVSLVISAALSAVGAFLPNASSTVGIVFWQVLNFLISFGLVTVLFALIYKALPDVEIAWKDVWVGAAVTALLFGIGKYLIGLYLGQSGVSSTYGAAGSLVIILLWVYYSSQILLFGAEFTQVYANSSGKQMVAADNAEPIPDSESGGRLAPGKIKPSCKDAPLQPRHEECDDRQHPNAEHLKRMTVNR